MLLLNHSDDLIIGKPKPSVLLPSPEPAIVTLFNGKNSFFRPRRYDGGVQSEFVKRIDEAALGKSRLTQIVATKGEVENSTSESDQEQQI